MDPPADADGIEKKKDQPKITASLRGAKRRGNPFSSRSLWDRAVLRTAGDADCHGLRPRNDVVFFTRSFCL